MPRSFLFRLLRKGAKVALALLLGASMPTAGAAESKWLTFTEGVDLQMSEDGNSLSVRIPVEPSTGVTVTDWSQCKAVQRDLVSRGQRPEKLSVDFRATFQSPATELGPALIISGPADSVPPGTLSLKLDLIPPSGGATPPAPQSVTLTLRCPVPQLKLVRPISIWKGWDGDVEKSKPTLELREEGDLASARRIRFQVVPDPSNPPQEQTGSLKVLKQSSKVVPRGDVASWQLDVEGEFPLGRSSGTIQVRTDGVAAPLLVSYEVHSRRTPWWIVWLTAGGLFMGWLVRIFLADRIARATARAAASRVLGDFGKARDQSADAIFRQQLEKSSKTLQAAANSRDIAIIQAATATARAELITAQSELAARRQRLADELVPLRELLQRPWLLPPKPAAEIDSARQLVERIMGVADSQDIASAQRIFDSKIQPSLVPLVEAAGNWRSACGKYFQSIANSMPALTQAAQETLAASIQGWRSSFGTRNPRVSVNRSELSDELITIHNAYYSARELVKDLDVEREKFSNWIRKMLTPPLSAELFNKVLMLLQEHESAIADDLLVPDAVGASPANRQDEEISLWLGIMKDMVPAGTTLDPAPIQTDLEESHWEVAVRTARAQLMSVAPNQAKRAALPDPPSTALKGLRLTNVGAGNASRLPRSTGILTGGLLEQLTLEKQGKLAAAIQSFVLFGILIVIAFVFYESQWHGKAPEMIGLFSWAFALDLSTASILPVLKKTASPGL